MDDGEKLLVFNLIGLCSIGHELKVEKDDHVDAKG